MGLDIDTLAGGIGPVSCIGIGLVFLKLIGVISWSWWYVALPFWLWFAVAAFIGVVIPICFLVAIFNETIGK